MGEKKNIANKNLECSPPGSIEHISAFLPAIIPNLEENNFKEIIDVLKEIYKTLKIIETNTFKGY